MKESKEFNPYAGKSGEVEEKSVDSNNELNIEISDTLRLIGELSLDELRSVQFGLGYRVKIEEDDKRPEEEILKEFLTGIIRHADTTMSSLRLIKNRIIQTQEELKEKKE